jgi:rhamnosyltransferase
MHLSILIRIHNEAAALKKTLFLIQKQKTTYTYEIVVSDHNSTDNSVEVANSFGCRVVHNTATSFSYGQLLNFGIENCKGQFVLIMSAHIALLNSDAIENLIKPFNDDQVACVSGTPATSIDMIMHTLNPKHYTIDDFKDIDNWKNWNLYEPFLFMAPCGAIRKAVWEQIPFNEALEITEDRHWGRAILEAGYTSVLGVASFYTYFAKRSDATNRSRAYKESLAMYRVYGKPEIREHFYKRSVKTIFSQAYNSLIKIPVGLYALAKIYAIRFKKRP